MAGPRRYTTKIRAKRIALQYFRRSHPFRRWKFILSVAAPLVAALWLLVYAMKDDQRIYNGGPVSTAHAMFETECRLCHGPGPAEGTPVATASLASAAATPAGFFLYASDRACKTCHAGPTHQANETFTPECATCHVEHIGRAVLAQIADRHCVQCHAGLQTKDGKPSKFHKDIPAFDKHPEFAISVRDGDKVARVRLDQKTELRDTAQVKLNHTKHMKVNLKGLDELQKQQPGAPGIVKVKAGAQLGCTFCHRPDERGQYLQPVAYAPHCASCHPLDFDGRFGDSVLPHDKAGIVHAFLRGTLSEAFDQCQAIPAGDAGKAIRERCVELELAKAAPAADAPRGRRGAAAEEAAPPDEPRGRRRGGAEAEAAPPADAPRGRRGAAAEEAPAVVSWVSTQMAAIEPGVFKQRCEYCHTVTKSDGPVPNVALTAIPARWLPHARFDHSAHRPVACAECHKAAASTETKDVLLPSIATCRECHTPKAGARATCVECHRYHDKTQERDPDGPFKVLQMLHRGGAPRADRVR